MVDNPQVEFFTDEAWHNLSLRTWLYYAQRIKSHLGAKLSETDSIIKQLEKKVSLQGTNFEEARRFLSRHGIINHDTGQLTATAYNTVKTIMENDMGSYLNEIDGYVICEMGKKERLDWCKESVSIFQKMFEPLIKVNNLKISSYIVPYNLGVVHILDLGYKTPILTVYMMNTARMESVSEISDYIVWLRQFESDRKAAIWAAEDQMSPEDFRKALKSGTVVISLVAAPTYENKLATELLKGNPPLPVTGPINLALLANFFTKQNERQKRCMYLQYASLLDLLTPGNGFDGITDAYQVVRLMERALAKCPALS